MFLMLIHIHVTRRCRNSGFLRVLSLTSFFTCHIQTKYSSFPTATKHRVEPGWVFSGLVHLWDPPKLMVYDHFRCTQTLTGIIQWHCKALQSHSNPINMHWWYTTHHICYIFDCNFWQRFPILTKWPEIGDLHRFGPSLDPSATGRSVSG